MMKSAPKSRAVGLMLAVLISHSPLALSQPAQIPVSDFFRVPSLTAAALSPSGRAVALRIGSPDARDQLAVLTLDTMKVQPVAAVKDADVNRFQWVNDRRLVFDVAESREPLANRRYALGLFAVDDDGGRFRELAQRGTSFFRNADDPERLLPWNTFLLGQQGSQSTDEVFVVQPEGYSAKGADYFQLLRLNTRSGRATPVDAPTHSFRWIIDGNDTLRAAVTSEDDRSTIYRRDTQTGTWRKTRELQRFGVDDLTLVGAAADGRLYATSSKDRDTTALFVYDPEKDELAGKALLATAQFDVEPLLIESDKGLLGARFTVDAEVTHWFDPAMKSRQEEVDKLLPATANMLTPPRRGDSPWLLVRAHSDVQPLRFFAYHTGTHKLTLLGNAQPGIQAARMSAMDMVRFKARDGREIPAYLTLPIDSREKKNLPLIVYVHGGPWVRGNRWGWAADVQFLASRGYAVLQPEFRGSTGFGSRHFRAGWKQWGLAMQDDLADAAKWAIAQGIADPRRICIMGGSYGGYAALMGLAKDGDLFRCGVSWAAVTDIQLMYDAHWSDMSDEWKTYGMPVLIGDRVKDADRLKATSPINLAAQIRNPLLLAHGGVDKRVPVEHGRRMRDALKPYNDRVEWIEYGKEGHGWIETETTIDFWTRVEKFLARAIGPDAK